MKNISSEMIKVTHKTVEVDVSFDKFTANLESALGRFDPTVGQRLATDHGVAEAEMARMAGEQGLMMFGSQDHGSLFAMLGKKMKAKRYHIGNPLIAIKMTQHDIRAGLYAPMTVLVYEVAPMKVRIDYDQPSTQLGQFKDEAIDDVAAGLDMKLEKLIEKVALLSN